MLKRPRNLRAYRAATGETQVQLAARLGITQSAYSRIELGYSCGLKLAKRIADQTGVPLDSFGSRISSSTEAA